MGNRSSGFAFNPDLPDMGVQSPFDHGLPSKQPSSAHSEDEDAETDNEDTGSGYPVSQLDHTPLTIKRDEEATSKEATPEETTPKETLHDVLTDMKCREVYPVFMNTLGLHVEKGLLPRMTVPLHPFQVMGVAWSRRQEESKGGGMLADEMGLGKTLQALGTICSDPAINPRKKNLIVVPSSLRDQWAHEIETKTDGSLKVLIWHGSGRWNRMKEFEAAHIVLTSYETLRQEWNDPKQVSKDEESPDAKTSSHSSSPQTPCKVESEETATPSKEPAPKNSVPSRESPLFTTEWYRLVLDEAQNIRNRDTLTSRAIMNIKAHFKMLLSGTPLVNSLADLFPMCKLLDVPVINDDFSFDICITSLEKDYPKLAAFTLRRLLIQSYVLRRNKNSTLNGKKLLELPPKTVQTHEFSFSLDEQRAYDGVDRMASLISNKFYLESCVPKSVTHPFVLLLRWRQCCIHPYLIQERPPEEEKRSQPTTPGVKFEERMLTSVLNGAVGCALCEEPISDTWVNPIALGQCDHRFCDQCILEYEKEVSIHRAQREDAQSEDVNHLACPLCFKPLDVASLVSRDKSSQMQQEADGEQDFLSQSVPKQFIPSTKMKFMMALLKMWRDDPKTTNDKIIILSQFTSALDLADFYLRENHFTHVRYQGKTSDSERAERVRTFMTDNRTSVMLLSLKAGGLGLNLTRANRVILLDPGWNVAVEDQAFSRCHRIGQCKPVFVHRLIIKGTIEEKMLTVYQARKKALADAAFDERS